MTSYDPRPDEEQMTLVDAHKALHPDHDVHQPRCRACRQPLGWLCDTCPARIVDDPSHTPWGGCVENFRSGSPDTENSDKETRR